MTQLLRELTTAKIYYQMEYPKQGVSRFVQMGQMSAKKLKNKQLSLGNASRTQIKTDEGDLCCLNYWGATLHYIANVDVNRYSLVEVGLTELGLSLCRKLLS